MAEVPQFNLWIRSNCSARLRTSPETTEGVEHAVTDPEIETFADEGIDLADADLAVGIPLTLKSNLDTDSAHRPSRQDVDLALAAAQPRPFDVMLNHRVRIALRHELLYIKLELQPQRVLGVELILAILV